MITRKAVRKRAASVEGPKINLSHNKNNSKISHNNKRQGEIIRTISSSKQVAKRVDAAKRARGKKSPSTNVMFVTRCSRQETKSCNMSIRQVML